MDHLLFWGANQSVSYAWCISLPCSGPRTCSVSGTLLTTERRSVYVVLVGDWPWQTPITHCGPSNQSIQSIHPSIIYQSEITNQPTHPSIRPPMNPSAHLRPWLASSRGQAPVILHYPYCCYQPILFWYANSIAISWCFCHMPILWGLTAGYLHHFSWLTS